MTLAFKTGSSIGLEIRPQSAFTEDLLCVVSRAKKPSKDIGSPVVISDEYKRVKSQGTRLQGADSARLGMDIPGPLKRFTYSSSGVQTPCVRSYKRCLPQNRGLKRC